VRQFCGLHSDLLPLAMADLRYGGPSLWRTRTIENRLFRSNAVILNRNFRCRGRSPLIIFAWLV